MMTTVGLTHEVSRYLASGLALACLAGWAVRRSVVWFGLLLVLAFICTTTALAYPEHAARFGYNTCAACHVSPAGGGMLTQYGRMTQAELATWQGASSPAALLPASIISVGGDVRGVTLDVRSPQGMVFKRFLMQADMEAALRLAPNVAVVGSVGRYGERPDGAEVRRSYVLLNAGEHVSLRAGRFMQAYGINTPDHTLVTRQNLGLGQGRETYNAEAALVTPLGELFLTAVAGSTATVQMTGGKGYELERKEPGAGVARAGVYLGKHVTLGASYSHADDKERTTMAGAHLIAGALRFISMLAEVDRRWSAGAFDTVGMARVGFQLVKGFHLFTQYQGARHMQETPHNRYGLTAQWFPVTQWEVTASIEWIDKESIATLLMGHYNL